MQFLYSFANFCTFLPLLCTFLQYFCVTFFKFKVLYVFFFNFFLSTLGAAQPFPGHLQGGVVYCTVLWLWCWRLVLYSTVVLKSSVDRRTNGWVWGEVRYVLCYTVQRGGMYYAAQYWGEVTPHYIHLAHITIYGQYWWFHGKTITSWHVT